MKNIRITTLIALVLGLSLAFSSCKKEDTVAPSITLTGDNPANIDLGDSYTDSGATATDDVDGDLTAEIVVTGSVNTNASGSYTLTYTVVDAAGNIASVDRTVNVNVTRDTYLGSYSTSEDCPQPYGLSSSPNITAGTASNEIVLSLYYFNGGSLTMTVDGSNVTINSGQTPPPVADAISGSGTLSADGTTITMNVTMAPQGASQVNCTVTWTKQ